MSRPASPFALALRGALRQPMLVAGLVLLGAVVLIALVGPLLHDTALAGIGTNRPRRPPGGDNPLGTDAQGRDILAALILATPQTLKIGLFAGIIGLGVGVLLGLVAGFFRGVADAVIRTAADVMMTIPGIAVLVLVATNVRTMSVALMAIIVAGLAWMYPTRTIRAQTLSMRERPYVDIARINGIGGIRLVLTEILPNLLPYIAASFVTAVSSAMLATIGLEALGLGPQNDLTLGMMIYWAQYYGAILRNIWWWWLPPVVMLAIIFIGLLMTSAGMDRIVNARLRVES
ncbi:ABC transporter permease [uncultured Alsobacter sp.]|uniref:ABC transporter permease n=1 Tax=uncultured Alsobacter sp. TaxID=1748258 RepID=UPI0025D4C606|nr:ABC transporter permease [uncultured Alsobacter sp.]